MTQNRTIAALEQTIANLVDRVERRHYGKYRGIVVDNDDPEQLGRLRVRVPSVLGSDVVTGWAKVCVPYGGSPNEGWMFIPLRGAGVWVEFEEGDLEFPIWTGTYYSKAGGRSEAPAGADALGDATSDKILRTAKGHTLRFHDGDGDDAIEILDGTNGHTITLDATAVTIKGGTTNGNSVVMDATGITISDKNGNVIRLRPGGIQIGDHATEPIVLGNTFQINVASFLTALSTHTHIGNLGAPTSPPVLPINLTVPVSTQHKVE